MMQWALNPIEFMETNRQRYGDLFGAPVSPVSDDNFVFVNHPEALQYILTHDSTAEITAPGEPNRIVERLLGSRSLILLSGANGGRSRDNGHGPDLGIVLDLFTTRHLSTADG